MLYNSDGCLHNDHYEDCLNGQFTTASFYASSLRSPPRTHTPALPRQINSHAYRTYIHEFLKRHQALHRQVEVSSGESQGVLCANSINLSCSLDFLRLGAGSFRQPTYLPRFVGKLLKIHRKFLTDSVKSLQNISKYVKGKSCLLQIVPPQLPTPRNTFIRFDFQRFFGI